MRRYSSRGFYHVALLFVAGNTFNMSIQTLTGVNLATRIFSGITIPSNLLAILLCVCAVAVLWKNWAD